jgi:DNA-binding transcriptional LysR family regulator
VIRREVDRFLREHGVQVEVVLEFDNIENIKKAIEIAAGVALLPRQTLEREIQRGTLVAVGLGSLQFVRPLGVIHSKSHSLSSTAKKFIDLLRKPDGHERGAGYSSGAFASGTPPVGGGNGPHRGSNGRPRSSKRARGS